MLVVPEDVEVNISRDLNAVNMCLPSDIWKNLRGTIKFRPRCNGKWRSFVNRFEIFSRRDNLSRLSKDKEPITSGKGLGATGKRSDQDEWLAESRL